MLIIHKLVVSSYVAKNIFTYIPVLSFYPLLRQTSKYQHNIIYLLLKGRICIKNFNRLFDKTFYI